MSSRGLSKRSGLPSGRPGVADSPPPPKGRSSTAAEHARSPSPPARTAAPKHLGVGAVRARAVQAARDGDLDQLKDALPRLPPVREPNYVLENYKVYFDEELFCPTNRFLWGNGQALHAIPPSRRIRLRLPPHRHLGRLGEPGCLLL